MTALRVRLSIARIMMFIAAVGVTLAACQVQRCARLPASGCDPGRRRSAVLVDLLEALQRRTVGRFGVIVLTLLIAAAPYILFFDPIDYWPGRRHVAREPLALYLLFSDDVPYISASRNWERTVSNLFEPHNTHIVPAWRILTWVLVQAAGSLERIPQVLRGGVVFDPGCGDAARRPRGGARDRADGGRPGGDGARRDDVGDAHARELVLGRSAALGRLRDPCDPVVCAVVPAVGESMALALGGAATVIAGWFWTIGHVAGPAAAVYLWRAGSRRCRRAAIAPLAATAFAVGLALGLGGRHIDSTISFHGRDLSLRGQPRSRACCIPVRPFRKTWFSPTLACRSRPRRARACCSRCCCSLRGPGMPGSGAVRETDRGCFAPLECAGFAIVMSGLPRRVDLSRLHGLSVSAHDQPAIHRSLVRRGPADRGCSPGGRAGGVGIDRAFRSRLRHRAGMRRRNWNAWGCVCSSLCWSGSIVREWRRS